MTNSSGLNLKRVFLGLAFCVSVGAGAFAHSGATGIVKERMDAMVAIGKAMKGLVETSKAPDVDAERAMTLARSISTHSGEAMLERFPKGSLPMVSEASPAIWENWDEFARLAHRLDGLAVGIEASVSSKGPKGPLSFAQSDPLPDLEILQTIGLDGLVEATKRTCAGCHKAFRIKK